MDLLTSTSLATMRKCPRMYQLRYQLGWSRDRVRDVFRFGSAYHNGLEAFNRGASADEAAHIAGRTYSPVPDWADEAAWQLEAVQVGELVYGHCWRYGQEERTVLAAEQTFRIDVRNPETRRRSKSFQLAGKIDCISMRGGRLVIEEYKTAGEEIDSGASYWLRLRFDQQISIYMLAAREIGFNVEAILYDVCRKPCIRQKQTETVEAYRDRLRGDIQNRPEWYYQRNEIARTDADLAEARRELWLQAEQLLDVRKHGRWYRNVTALNCNHCEFQGPCLEGRSIDPQQPWPGYVQLSTTHPELEETNATTSTAAAAPAEPAGCA